MPEPVDRDARGDLSDDRSLSKSFIGAPIVGEGRDLTRVRRDRFTTEISARKIDTNAKRQADIQARAWQFR